MPVEPLRLKPPVGRLAPSPTGLLHLGHARTFLIAWWHLRSRGGVVGLRIEDLDGPRCEPRWIDAALRDLEWLGLDWDGPWTLQSRGMARLKAAVDRLVADGLTYPCVCSRADVRSASSAPQQGVAELRYPGTCRGRFDSLEQAERATGRSAAIRFRVPPGAVEIVDAVCGRVLTDVEREVGDFVVARRDHTPAYQVAVVVDDAAQDVTEVHRGADLLSSASRQWHIRTALRLPHVLFHHLPLVLDGTGRRLAKRCDDLSLADLRQRGTDPRAIVGWAARTAGLQTPDRIRPDEALSSFRIERLPQAPVVLTAQIVQSLKQAT